MASPSRRQSRMAGSALLTLALVLVLVAWLGSDSRLAAAPTILAIFLGPGVGWLNLRGRLQFNPATIGLAVAVSIGSVVVVGLAMNAVAVSLDRQHWAGALAIVLGALGAAGIVRPAAPEETPAEPAREGRRWRTATAVAVAATCTALAAGGALIAWYSQERWLARQHYTELYAVGSSSLQAVTVHNHEGERVSYQARISAAGSAPQIVSFTLADGKTWTRSVEVDPTQATDKEPMLAVELARVGVPGVYRFIRLLRPQPTERPAF